MATIIARPHPLRSDCYSAEVADGATLYELMGDMPECVLSQIDGEVWGRDRWSESLPAGALVTLYSTPEGENAGRAIAMIAIAVLSIYTGGAAAGAAGAAGFGTTAAGAIGAAASAATTLAGSLAVNALIPPKMAAQQSIGQSPNVRQSITGTRNQADPYGVVPRVYGNPRWYPKLAATPVTEIAGNDQYLRMLLCMGYGPLEIDGTRVGGSSPLLKTRNVGDAIRIGETSIDEFEDVEWEVGAQDKLSLKFPDIHEEAVGVALNAPWHSDDSWYPDNVSAIRTTATNTREISVDIAFPAGIFSTDKKGKRQWASVRFSIRYRPTGGGAWTTVESQWQVDGKSADTMRFNRRWAVPVGQYDVEVKRTESLYWGSSGAHYDANWTVMRSIQEGPAYTGDHVLMALRIRATDQLNGVIDQLNVKTQAVLRTYNGTSFVEQATSNPAWAYLDSMTGQQVGKPVPDAQIDWAGIRDWAAFCASQGLEYHFVHDGAETVLERARAIASTGQASFALQDGLFGVVRDDATAPVVQAITPRNATGFSSSRTFKDLPHALRVKYIDPDTWSDAERYVYRDGYDETNATRFEDFETQGVASADEAYHHGAYHFRQAILRPETHTVSMDWENLAVMRGNRVRLAYDAIKVGLGWGRVKSVDGATIVLDDEVQHTTQKAYGIRVRGAEGPQGTTVVTASTIGQTDTLTMVTPVDVRVGDLVLYGELDKESIDCKVTSIQHGGDFTADLTLVPAATDIYNYGEPPVWDAGITNPIPVDRIRPPTPRITDVRGDESAAHIGQDGTPVTLLRVAYAFTAQVGLPSLEVEARYRIVEDGDADPWSKAGPFAASGNLTIRDVDDGSNYEVQVRAINGAMYSPWSQTAALTVSGKGVSVPISVDVRRGTFTLTLIPQGLYPNQQWEFYRSAAPLALGDVEDNAVNLGVAVALTDVDLMPDTTYYYYVRGWSISYTSAWYPVEAKTENSPNAVMAAISGEIKKSDLWPALEAEIDKIGTVETGLGQVQQDLADEAARLDGRVDGVQSDLAGEANRLDGEINSVSNALDSARNALEQADTELSGRLDSAETAIVDERTERETEQGYIVDRLDGLVSNVGDNRASIGRLQRIQQEGDELDAIIYEALNVESASRRASIRTEERVRIDGDSALAIRTDSLEADIGDANARITTVDQARADGDSALSSQIGELSAKVNVLPQFASGFESGADFDQWIVASTDTLTAETGDIYTGLQSGLLTSTLSAPAPTDATRAAIPSGATDAFEGFEITVSIAAKQPANGASAEFAVAYSAGTAGNSGWERFAPTDSWQTFEFSYSVPEGSAETTDYIGIWADTSGSGAGVLIDSVNVRRVAGEILEITAAIQQANQARADGDAALTQQINALTTTVGNNTSSIQQEAQTRADENSALTQTTSALRADVDDNAAGITTVEQAVADTESALSSRIDGVSARTGQNETSINSERTARTNADEALGTRIDSVTVTAGDNSAGLAEEVRVRADETGANAQAISSLSLSGGQQKAAIQALQRLQQEGENLEAIQFESINVESASRRASIRTEEQARVEDGVAFASRMSSIETSVDDVDARVTSEETARADGDSALGQRIDTVQATAGNNVTAIQQEITARTNADSALGSQISTVQSQLGDDIASVQQQAQTNIDAQKDRINAMWTLRTDVNGLVGGMGLANDGQTVDMAFRTDTFSIAPPGLPANEVIPFIVKGSTTYLKEAMIDQLTFDKLTDAGGTFIVENGKLKAEYIETNSLIVSSGNVTGLGSLATKNGVNYNELGGTKPPSNADNTGSNTAADTAKVGGESSSSIKNKANAGSDAKNRVDGWSYPGTTEIHGAHIRTGTIKADKIQIGGSGGLGSLATQNNVDYDSVTGAPGVGGNLIKKSTFEDNDTGDWSITSLTSLGGAGSLRALRVVAGGGSQYESGNRFRVNPGQIIVGQYAASPHTSGGISFGLRFSAQDGATIGWEALASPGSNGSVTGQIVVPEGAVTALPWIEGGSGSGYGAITNLFLAYSTTENWAKPGTTLIDGGKLYTHDAFIVNAMIKNAAVDTLEIKGEAVAVTRFINSGSTGNLVAGKESPGSDYSSWYPHGSVGISTGSSGGQTVVTIDTKVECRRTNSSKRAEIQLQVYVVETGEEIIRAHALAASDVLDSRSWSTNIVIPANSTRTLAARYRWYSSSTSNLSAYVRHVRISATLMKKTGT